MNRKVETVEGRAVKIAAKVMQAAGLCRYDDVSKCRRIYVDESTCDVCIEKWLLSKARRELKGENMDWNEFAKEVHQVAVDNGWWDEPVPVEEFTVACHAELSAAVEEYRMGRLKVYHICTETGNPCCLECGGDLCVAADGDPCGKRSAKPQGVAVELADCVLRILDYMAQKGVEANIQVAPYPSRDSFYKRVELCHYIISGVCVEQDMIDHSTGRDPAGLQSLQTKVYGDLETCAAIILGQIRDKCGEDFEAVLRAKLEYNRQMIRF